MVMEPLSRRTRLVLLATLVCLFILILPAVLLSASGWRLGDSGLVRIGGISVTMPESAELWLDGELVGASGFFNRRIYLNNLVPGAYRVQVSREAYLSWEHTLFVEPQIVTDVRAFLLPQAFTRLLLQTATTTATTTRVVSRRTYDVYLAEFSQPMATTSDGAFGEAGSEALFIEKGNVIVRWLDERASVTSNFCGRPSLCLEEIPIETGPETATAAAYYAGGVLYRTKEGGVYLRENTVLPDAVLVPVTRVRGADFRIVDGALILKEGKILYQIGGF